jgi:hypothetical protein
MQRTASSAPQTLAELLSQLHFSPVAILFLPAVLVYPRHPPDLLSWQAQIPSSRAA